MSETPSNDDRGDANGTLDDQPEGTLVGGRYRLVRRIGEGAMGSVYLARHEGLQRSVAVKFLKEELTGNREVAERFAREAIAAARLEHPNVIAVHDAGTDERGRCFLAMEYIEGELLRDVLERARALPHVRVIELARPIAKALDHAHSLGIVHRDVKPENVLIGRREGAECVKVIDFGIAKIFQPDGPAGAALTRTGIVLGTPEYMAPEQAAGTAIDHRADLYALAVVVYEMTVGRRPFDHEDIMALLMAHLTATAPAPSAVYPEGHFSPEVDAVFARALSKAPADRYANAVAFVDALEAAFDAPPVERTPTEPAPPEAPAPAPVVVPAPVTATVTVTGWRALPALARWGVIVGGAALSLGLLLAATRGAHRNADLAPEATPIAARRRAAPAHPEGRPAPVDDLRARIAALRARADLPTATARQRESTARALEAQRAASPRDAALAFVLGGVYARDRDTASKSLDAYRDAQREAPALFAEEPMADDVARIYATSPTLAAPASELLRGPLVDVALDPLVAAAVRGPGRARIEALLAAPPFAGRVDATQRGLIALSAARSCEAKRPVVEALGRDADERALPALRRIPTGSGCGFLSLGTCNACMNGAVSQAIRAIESRRPGDAGR